MRKPLTFTKHGILAFFALGLCGCMGAVDECMMSGSCDGGLVQHDAGASFDGHVQIDGDQSMPE